MRTVGLFLKGVAPLPSLLMLPHIMLLFFAVPLILFGHYYLQGYDQYDLIIIDEAHRYRNHTSQMFQNMQEITKAPRANKGGISGVKKKVILISATPLNNKPMDIYNQLLLFQDSRNSTLPVENLQSFFYPLSLRYSSLKSESNINHESLREIYKLIRSKVIEPITIRRTRKDLESILEYKKDIEKQKILFPEIVPPKSLEYTLDQKTNKLFYNTVFTLTDRLSYVRYKIIYYLTKENIDTYYPNLPEASSSKEQLPNIMKTFLIKRLESSFHAFKKSLERFEIAIDNLISMFEKDKIFIAPDFDINKYYAEGREDELEEMVLEWMENDPESSNRIFTKNDFLQEFLELLQKDKKIIHELNTQWKDVKTDPKMDCFIKHIRETFFDPTINPTGKLIIFSESKETSDEIHKNLERIGKEKILAVNSKNRKDKINSIQENFDANLLESEQKDEYDILVSTEVLSEGINLHRANIIVNYDTPWNATRLMQRIGRVNRIGTKAKQIFIYNFKPSAQGDDEIKLNQNTFQKLQSFHYAFGEDNQIYTEEEVIDNDQIKLFKAGLTETVDERLRYLHFLREFKKNNLKWFQRIQKLPNKSRLARDTNTLQKKEWSGSTVSYLESSNRKDYFLIHKDIKIESLTFLEVVKYFETKEEEVRKEILDWHYDHVLAAVQRFHRDFIQEKETESEKHLKINMAGNIKISLSFLNTLLAQKLSEENVSILIQMKKTIEKGTYIQLPNEIEKLEKKFKRGTIKLERIISEIIELSKKYIFTEETIEERIDTKEVWIEKPEIILAESFI